MEQRLPRACSMPAWRTAKRETRWTASSTLGFPWCLSRRHSSASPSSTPRSPRRASCIAGRCRKRARSRT
eukprot:5276053-Prymnesium_polylepis.1